MDINVQFSIDPALLAAIASFVKLFLPNNTQLDRIEAAIAKQTQQEIKDMAAIDDELTSLTAQVAANTTVIGSAEQMISGIGAQVQAAVAAALAAGATPTQLAAITALQSTLTNDDTALAAAIAAATPAAAATPPAAAAALTRKLA